MLKIIRENPGLTVGDIVDRMGKADHYVETMLWRLKKYTVSLRIEVTGYEHAGAGRVQEGVERPEDGLEARQREDEGPLGVQAVQVEQWLKKGYFGSITELLEDYKNAKVEERRYYHIDIMGEFLNSWKASNETKNSIGKVIRGYYSKNTADLPREKLVFNKEMLLDTTGSVQQYVKPEEIWRIVNDGYVQVRDKSILTVLLYRGDGRVHGHDPVQLRLPAAREGVR